MKTNINFYAKKEELVQNIDSILNNLSRKYNIYLHHIWGLKDKESDIKNSILKYGLEVKYKKSMMSTCFLVENPTGEKIVDYYFSHEIKNRYIVALAIPKELKSYNGNQIPFSNNVKPIATVMGDKLNDTIVSVFDACKGNGIDNEFVLFAIKTDVTENNMYELELNENHISNTTNEQEILQNYYQKMQSTFDITEEDSIAIVADKINDKLDDINLCNAEFYQNYTDDFDFD